MSVAETDRRIVTADQQNIGKYWGGLAPLHYPLHSLQGLKKRVSLNRKLHLYTLLFMLLDRPGSVDNPTNHIQFKGLDHTTLGVDKPVIQTPQGVRSMCMAGDGNIPGGFVHNLWTAMRSERDRGTHTPR